MKKRLAVIVQLYYTDLWDEFKSYLQNITDQFDLYVTITEGVLSMEDFQSKAATIKQAFPNASVIMVQNKGLDIGPFVLTLHSILQQKLEYEYVIKLHTKRSINTMGEGGDQWRQELIHSLLGTPQKYYDNLQKFHDPQVGMIGCRKWVIDHLETNTSTIDYYKHRLGIKKGRFFVGGTIFWSRFETLIKCLTTQNTIDIYNELEEGYFTDWNAPTKTHALERIFGYIIEDNGQKIVGV